MYRISVLLLFLFFSPQSLGNTPLINEKLTIDFSKSEDTYAKKEYRDKIIKFAQSFAKEGTVYKKPLSFDSINMVINPVLKPEKYQHSFRFNLKAEDGEIFNCIGVTDKKWVIYSVGCYQAIR